MFLGKTIDFLQLLHQIKDRRACQLKKDEKVE